MLLLVALRLTIPCSGGLINTGLEVLSVQSSGLESTGLRYLSILARQR